MHPPLDVHKLKQLWSSSFECFLYGAHLQYSRCTAEGSETRAVKMDSDVAFGITAFNPADPRFQQSPSIAENMKQSSKLFSVLHRLASSIRPLCITESFGFSLEGWRENGYTVGCSLALKDEVREKILEIAKAFGQGAIYEYTRINENLIQRDTVATSDEFKATEATVILTGMDPAEYWTDLADEQR